MNDPLLIIVTGRPGSGKTTLAHALAHTIRCPALCCDEFKEGLVNTLRETVPPDTHSPLNQQVYSSFFQAIELLLHNGISLVAEAAVQHKLWQPKLEPLQAIAQIRILVCSIDPLLARARMRERGLADPQREAYHPINSLQQQMTDVEPPLGVYEPPHLTAVPVFSVDTMDGYKPTLQQIKDWALHTNAMS